MWNKRIHRKNATHWNKCKPIGSTPLSECYMQLTTKFRSAGFLCQPMLLAIGWCWNESSWVVQTQLSGGVVLCSMVMFSSSPWWPCTVMRSWGTPPCCLLGHPLLSSLPGVWHLPRGSQTHKDLGSSLQARQALRLSALGCVSRALAVSFEWWHTELSSDKLGWSLAALADIYPQLCKLEDAYFVKQKTVKKEILSSVCCLDILCIASII